ERLSFSLFEFWITMLGCGASIGLIISRLEKQNVGLNILLGYTVFHTFCVALLGAVYEARKRREAGKPANQLLLVLLFELPALAAWIGVGLAIDVPVIR